MRQKPPSVCVPPTWIRARESRNWISSVIYVLLGDSISSDLELYLRNGAMPTQQKLTSFSYAVLVLVGEGGAGAHDLVRMMREGQHVFWAASASQWYAEPKRLAGLGLLHAEKMPGRTHERTHYTLTDAGRTALREWLAQPSAFTRIQCEPIVRLLAAEYVDPEVLER